MVADPPQARAVSGQTLEARLAPVVASLASMPPASRPADRLPADVHARLVEAGLWKLCVPRALGGLEQDLPSSLALFERAAAIDGSLGFALAIGTGGGLFGAWLPEPGARAIFTPAAALIAGSGVPTGIARPDGDGYLVDGDWRFASLIHSATWITASVRVADTDRVIAVAVPAGEVEILQTWQAQALSGTDSHDFRMRDVRVSSSHVFDLAAPPRVDGPLYRFDFMALAAAAFASVAVGIARGAVETARARRMGRLARATRMQRAAGQLLHDTVMQAWQQLGGEASLSPATVRAVRLAAVRATRQSVVAVEHLAVVAGMRLLAMHDPFSRAWRDVHGVAQHTLVSDAHQHELRTGSNMAPRP